MEQRKYVSAAASHPALLTLDPITGTRVTAPHLLLQFVSSTSDLMVSNNVGSGVINQILSGQSISLGFTVQKGAPGKVSTIITSLLTDIGALYLTPLPSLIDIKSLPKIV